MNTFRLLIKDLEEELKVLQQPSKGEISVGPAKQTSNQKWHY